MTIKKHLISLFILFAAAQISFSQQWVYNASGTEIKGSYRYASLTSGANDNPRSSSIYINYYNLDQKYNIYLYEITGLECSDNTVQFFTDVNATPQSFSTTSKSDGIETIALTAVEDLSAFFNEIKEAKVLTISISNTCGTGRDILFPMENTAEVVAFMSPQKVQDQVSSSSVKTEHEEQVSSPSVKTEHEVQEQVQQKVQEQVSEQESGIQSKPMPQSTNLDAEWARLTKRNKELDRKDSLLVVFQSQLDERELGLIQLEQELEAKSKELQSKASAASTPVTTAQAPTYTPTAPAYTPAAPITQQDAYSFRYVQFVATKANMDYNRLNYIGEIITEQIPGKNITRYKVMGHWSDADVARVKNQLAQEGFQGAFESK